MANISAMLELIGTASKLAHVLQHIDQAKYQAELGALGADIQKLMADMKALEQQAVADMEALKAGG